MSSTKAPVAAVPMETEKFSPSADAPWLGCLRNLPREHGYENLKIEGKIPDEINGALFRVGPGMFSILDQPYRHWFDGDGAITGIRLQGGKAQGAVKIIQSDGLEEEMERKRPLFDTYGTNLASPLRRAMGKSVKNTANTSVMVYGHHLLALMEGGLPTEIRWDDLATIGEWDLNGVVRKTFSAHPHRVSARGANYNFGVRFGRRCFLDIYELHDHSPARRLAEVPLPGLTMVHDFIATPRYLIFFVSPLRLRVLPMLAGLKSFSESLDWQPELGTEVIVVPIVSPDSPIRFQTEAFFQWHFGNAFEKGDELVVAFIRYPNFDTNRWLAEILHGRTSHPSEATYYRAVLNLHAKNARFEKRLDRACEFPRVSPRALSKPHRFTYVALYSSENGARGLPDRLGRIDVEKGSVEEIHLGPEQYLSEPMFIPSRRSHETDDGYILTLAYDAKSDRSYLAVIDARTPMAGAVAKAWFDHAIPFTFHGGFATR